MSADRHAEELPGRRSLSGIIWYLLGSIADLEQRYRALQRDYDTVIATLWGSEPHDQDAGNHQNGAHPPAHPPIIRRVHEDTY
jgi:hypothetical protein